MVKKEKNVFRSVLGHKDFSKTRFEGGRKVDEEILTKLLESGESTGTKLFAAVGEAVSRLPRHNARGKKIEQQMIAIKRKPPVFGAIVVNEKTPSFLPQVWRSDKVVTFDFLPRAEHLKTVGDGDIYKQTLIGSVAHLALTLHDKRAYVSELQGNTMTTVPGGPTKEMLDGYSNSLLSLFLAAHAYCGEKRLSLHFFHPEVYLSEITGGFGAAGFVSPAQSRVVYGITRGLARRLFKTEKVEGGEYPRAMELVEKNPALTKFLPNTLLILPETRRKTTPVQRKPRA